MNPTMLIWDYEVDNDEQASHLKSAMARICPQEELKDISAANPFGHEPELIQVRSFAPSKKLTEKRVNSENLKKNLKEYLSDLQSLFDDIASTSDDFELDEIELHLMVNGNGSVGIVAKAEAGMEAGIKVKFKRKKTST